MKVWKFLLKVSKQYRIYILGSLLALTFIAIDKNIKPYLIKHIIDMVSYNNYESIWVIVIFYAIMQFIMAYSWTLNDYCSNNWYPQLSGNIAQTFAEKIATYSHRFFSEHLSGRISSKINDLATYSPRLIATIMFEFFQISVMLLITTILLAKAHWWFAIAIITWISLFSFISCAALTKAKKLSATSADAYSTVWGKMVDFISNIASVKLFAAFSYERRNLQLYIDDFVRNKTNKNQFLLYYYTVLGTLTSFYIIACLIAMLYLSKHGMITPGDFALILMLNFSIIDWLFQLSHILRDFISDWGSVDQALATLEVTPEVQDKSNASNLHVSKGLIVFNKVKFHYKGAEPLFENKSIIIEPGQKVGLVGYSGGGKTTFANLILRLYDVTDGAILIDGQNIKEVTQDSLHKAIAIIPQDPSLFHRSIMENIRYGCLESSDEEVIAAAKSAHAHEFIIKLPHGYDSLVGERGIKLSGGQRQRIAIARAILKNAPILILDEATSQLDSITEGLIQESLWKLMNSSTSSHQGLRDATHTCMRTTIVIAHRLSTLTNMDRILVFDKGKIIEDGTHNELIARDGLYKTLWDTQSYGMIVDQREKDY